MVLGRPGEGSSADKAALPISSSGKRSRGTIKRWQVESFAVVLQHLLLRGGVTGRQLHVVDFGCGTGTLLLPLAATFPHCRFTGVEMKPAAVALLLERARAAGLSNVAAVRGMIEEFTAEPFDVALALHACGNATDAALQLAARRRAAYVVSPCCVGKLKFSLAGGSSFSSSLHTYTPRLPGDRPPSRRPPAAPAADVDSTAGSTVESTVGSAEESTARGSSSSSCGATTQAGAPVGQGGLRAPPAADTAASGGGPPSAAGPGPGPGAGAAAAAIVTPTMEAKAVMKTKAVAGAEPPRTVITKPDMAAAATAAGELRLLAMAAAMEPGGVGSAAAAVESGPVATTAPAEPAAAEPRAAAAAADDCRPVTLGEVRHPRSAWMRQHLPQPDTHFRIMAKVADQNHSAVLETAAAEPDGGESSPITVAAAAARACKAHVELDRNLAAKEDGYRVGMFKCLHWREMAKNDLLVGVPSERQEWEVFGLQMELAPRL